MATSSQSIADGILPMSHVTATLQVTADLAALKEAREFIEQTAVACTSNPQTISDLILAVDEALTNIIQHGYQQKPGKIDISLSCQPKELHITLTDSSTHFDPTQVAPPDLTAPLSQRKPGGMGIHIMRQLTDQLKYQAKAGGGNQLTLIKTIESS